MARPNYGPQAQKRARRLFETLLTFANDEFEDCDLLYNKIKVNWQTDKQLVIRTKIRYLESLTGHDPYPGKLTAAHIKESLKRFDDHLEILEDNRTATQGSDTWHFTVHLWARRYDTQHNLSQFDQEWQNRRSLKSKQATAAVESASPAPQSAARPLPLQQATQKSHRDWGQATEAATFYGRTAELSALKQWVVSDRCRLVALLGMGGIGKTALSVKLAEQCQDEFEFLIWRSLRNAPPLLDLLADLIHFLSEQQATNLPDSLDGRLRLLMQYLQSHRCLLILDNMESILNAATAEQQRSGAYRKGYEGYEQLLRDIGETPHQSCLVLTSREKPRIVSLQEGEGTGVRSHLLKGLKQTEGTAVMQAKGMEISPEQSHQLVAQYGGNPLALQIVATTVQELFEGDIAQFIDQGAAVFGDISDLLGQQVSRLSDLEQQLMNWLAIYRDWVSLPTLQKDLVPAVPQRQVLEALESLQRRSLIEKQTGGFTQQPVVMEYITEQLIDRFSDAVLNPLSTEGESPALLALNRYPLTQAQTHDYLRQTQIQLLLRPIIERLTARLGQQQRVERALKQQLKTLKSHQALFLQPGYAPGNLLKLLHYSGADLTGLDCSELPIWEVYLQDMTLHQVNFAHADFRSSIFAQLSKRFLSAVFSPDSRYLATGIDQEIMLWDVGTCQPVMTYFGHRGWVQTLAFSPDGAQLASGSHDHTIRLWNVATGQCWKTLPGQGAVIQSVAFSPDGKTLASGDNSGHLHLWNPETGELIESFLAHQDRVFSVAFMPDSQHVISSGQDGTVQRWTLDGKPYGAAINTPINWSLACGLSPDGERLVTAGNETAVTIREWSNPKKPLHIETSSYVWATCFDPTGGGVVTASNDGCLRLWDADTGDCLKTLKGHHEMTWLATYSPDGQLLASCSDDQSLKLWKSKNGNCMSTIKNYSDAIMAVAFSPDGQTLASGSEDGDMRLWTVKTGAITATLKGHTSIVGAVQFSPAGDALATGSDDKTVRLWNAETGDCLRTFWGHEGWVQAIAFDPLGRFLASGGHDQTVRLWDMRSGECLTLLEGHLHRVKALAFSPDGQLLASGSDDQTIKLWNSQTGECCQTLEGHSGWVLTLDWLVQPGDDSLWLASGSADQKIRLWRVDLLDGKKDLTVKVEDAGSLVGHEGAVRAISFHPNGDWLISCSADHTLKLWQPKTGECLQTLEAHTEVVWSVDVRTDGLVASGSGDGTIRLWEANTGSCKQVLRPQRPYEGMNIAGTTGLSVAQRQVLRSLGAVECMDNLGA